MKSKLYTVILLTVAALLLFSSCVLLPKSGEVTDVTEITDLPTDTATENTATPPVDGKHKLTLILPDTDSLVGEVKEYYAAGEAVTVPIGIVYDVGTRAYLNDELIKISSYGDGIWYYTFDMPEQDTVFRLHFYEGFLPSRSYGIAIEKYWDLNPQRYSVSIALYEVLEYNATEYEPELCFVTYGMKDLDYTPWDEVIGTQTVTHPNSVGVHVVADKELYTLKAAYECGILNDGHIAKIIEALSEYYSHS